jgi:hypothetical protein
MGGTVRGIVFLHCIIVTLWAAMTDAASTTFVRYGTKTLETTQLVTHTHTPSFPLLFISKTACGLICIAGASNSESIQSVAKRIADAMKFCESLYSNTIIILVASHTVTSVAQSLYVGANLKVHTSLPPPLPSKARPLDKVAGMRTYMFTSQQQQHQQQQQQHDDTVRRSSRQHQC